MMTLRLSKNDAAKGPLILVNPAHPFKNEVGEKALTAVGGKPAVLLENRAARMLAEMMAVLNCQNEIVPVSGFRTLREQQTIFAQSLQENGEAFTGKYVAVPGCSEHQTGYAIDLAENTGDIDFIRPGFPTTGICGRFRSLAAKYGFIERYPAGAEDITCIAHEPWHFRYVGYPHSLMIAQQSMTLEEYTVFLCSFPRDGKHLRYEGGGREFEIFYIRIPSEGEIAVQLPEEFPFQVSGNNAGGAVVTLWRNRP